MTLVLQVTALNEEPMSQPLIGRFDERGGTLGRSDSATFTLPDPERMISRVQAQILYRDDGYWIENVSAATSMMHNGRALGAGMRVALRDTDELRIGGYTLLAAFENDAASATILRGRTVILPPPKGVVTSPRSEFAVSGSPPVAPAKEVPHTPDVSATTLAEPISIPEPVVPPPEPRQGVPNAAPAPVTPDVDALWRGFLQGAGIDLPLVKGLTPEVMVTIGTILRTAIDGVHTLVSMRATAKDDMRAEMTHIQLAGNNPLKFAPDGVVALQLLLQPPARGFLPAQVALRETMVDLQSHQVGMTAGMHSAVEAVLDRFDPAKVESQLTHRSVLESLLPAHHRARLWELYLEHYRSLRDEAREDFQRLFGEAFREAYEAQARTSADAAFELPEPRDPSAGGRKR
jgi:type VI secretion system FHA domain protein